MNITTKKKILRHEISFDFFASNSLYILSAIRFSPSAKNRVKKKTYLFRVRFFKIGGHCKRVFR